MICLLFVHEVSLPDLHFFNISCWPNQHIARSLKKEIGERWQMSGRSLPLPNLFQVDDTVKFDVLQLLV